MNFTLIQVFILYINEIKINYNKNCAQEIRQVKVCLGLKSPNLISNDFEFSTILVYSFMLLILSIVIQNKIEIPR